MKWIVYVLAVPLVALALVRRLRSRRRPPPRGAGHRLRRSSGRDRPLGDTGIVAAREISERLRGRFFKVITLILLAVVAAAIVIPTIPSSSRSVVRVGLVGVSRAEGAVVSSALAHVGVEGRTVPVGGVSAARADLHAHEVDLVVDGTRAVLVDTALPAGASTATARAASAVAAALGAQKAFRTAGLSSSQAAAVAGARPLPVLSVAVHRNGATRGTSVIGLIFTFILLTQYLTWTLVGVMEEKSSRVVEVLLSTVRPIQLLGGKVLGIGLVALLQAGLVVAFALVLGAAVGSDLLEGTAPLVVVASLAWLVLAYAFYSWVFAAAGSMAERQDQAQSLTLPLSVPIIVGYVLALVNAGPAPTSLFMKVLAYLPPTAPFGMPLLISKGEVGWWGVLLAALLSIASTVAVARFAAAVYRGAVLRTGRRVKVKEVLALRRGS